MVDEDCRSHVEQVAVSFTEVGCFRFVIVDEEADVYLLKVVGEKQLLVGVAP